MKKIIIALLVVFCTCRTMSAQVQTEIGLGYAGTEFCSSRMAVGYRMDVLNPQSSYDWSFVVGGFIGHEDYTESDIFDPVRSVGVFGRALLGGKLFRAGLQSDIELSSYHYAYTNTATRQLSINLQPCFAFAFTPRLDAVVNFGEIGYWSDNLATTMSFVEDDYPIVARDPGTNATLRNIRLLLVFKF